MKRWRAFITGATGFIGGHLARKLIHEGADVVTLVRDELPSCYCDLEPTTVIKGNVKNQALIERILNEYEVTHVFHLASQSLVLAANRSPIETFETNIAGTWSVLEACRRAGVERVIVASSDKAYGNSDELPYKEEMPLAGSYPYDVSKSCADLITQSFFKTYGLPVNIIRSANVYGPGDVNWSRLIPRSIRRILEGKPPILRGNGRIKRDYLFVEDVVAGYLACAQKATAGEAFNLGVGKPYSAEDVILLLLGVLESSLEPTRTEDAKGELADQYLCAEKAHRLLGWAASTPLLSGLERTVAWYKQYLVKG